MPSMMAIAAVVGVLFLLGLAFVLLEERYDDVDYEGRAVAAGSRTKKAAKAAGGLAGIGIVSLAGSAWQAGVDIMTYVAMLVDIGAQSPLGAAGIVNVGLVGFGITDWFGPIRAAGILLMIMGAGGVWKIQQRKNGRAA
ncbi:hypothetical protein [Halobaculum marinum]|uniref:Uncharacterized protein n=1 Tax=Halobaculum marinum TaxID=3031996 RepID=A0ABD5WUS2_9EURY|nr:hypothetical protein [Halobaculum sp. DT55]